MIIFGPNLNVAVVPYCRDNHLRSMMKEKKNIKIGNIRDKQKNLTSSRMAGVDPVADANNVTLP